jgi:Domain of unknown function (DUF4062)
MAKIYLSSTYADLRACRERAYQTLRSMRHDVVGMEDYVAAEQRPLARCLRDVAASDLYVGIFAWRYGYKPPGETRSITELEYREAGERGIPRLIFLLHPDAGWPASEMDAVTGDGDSGARIRALRDDLMREHVVSFFRTSDELGTLVSVAGHVQLELEESIDAAFVDTDTELPQAVLEQERPVVMIEAPAFIAHTVVEAIHQADAYRVLEVNLEGGDSWWSTRLFLLGAVSADFTNVAAISFLDGGAWVGLASPQAIRLRLGQSFPVLTEVYDSARRSANRPIPESVAELASGTVNAFMEKVSFPAYPDEQTLKKWVTTDLLRRWLGDDLEIGAVESAGHPVTTELLYEILNRDERFVPLVEGEQRTIVGLVDRYALAADVARGLLRRQLGQTAPA